LRNASRGPSSQKKLFENTATQEAYIITFNMDAIDSISHQNSLSPIPNSPPLESQPDRTVLNIKQRTNFPLIIGIVLVLVGIVGGAYYFGVKKVPFSDAGPINTVTPTSSNRSSFPSSSSPTPTLIPTQKLTPMPTTMGSSCRIRPECWDQGCKIGVDLKPGEILCTPTPIQCNSGEYLKQCKNGPCCCPIGAMCD